MSIFDDGTRIRVTKPAELYSYDEATQPEGKLAEGTEGTITTGLSFRGRVCVMTSDGVSGWVPHHCLERVDAAPSEITNDKYLQPVQSPENLRADDVSSLLNRLMSPYAETRQHAAVALAHAYCNSLLTSFDDVREAIMSGTIAFGPVAEVLLAQSRREMIDSLLDYLESASAEIRDRALVEWERLEK